MTWPPPSASPLPPPLPASPPPTREATARPIATWLAATGGSLVLVAAVIVVAGNWQDIPPALKLAGLVLVTIGLGAAAERTRDVVPATARAVAHLAAALVAPVGIAVAAVAGGTWPVCVLTGGVLAAVACDGQARRWRAPLLDGACVIAVGLALVGLAALVSVPIGMLAAVVAGGLMAIRRDTAAAALAAAATASPILVAIAEARVGDGTLARIGATGDVLAWSAPLAAVLAGGVLAVVAGRRNAPAVAVMALAAPLVGVSTGLATHGVDAVVWLCLPAIVLAALELVLAVATTDPWRRVTRPIADALAAAGAGVALALPVIAVWLDDTATLPLLLGAAALAMTTARRWPAALTIAGTGALAIAMSGALGWPLLGMATVAAAVATLTVLVAGPRWLPALPSMVTAAGFLLAADGAPLAEAAVALALLVLAVELACRTRGDQPAADLEIALSAFGGAVLVATCLPGHAVAVLLAALAVAAAVVAGRAPLRAPALWLPVIGAGTVLTVATPFDTWVGAGVLALSASAAVTWWRTQELWIAHLAAGLAVVAAPFALTAIGATAVEVAAAMLIVAVVLTGSSFVVLTSGPVASAAMTASAVAAVVAPAGSAVLVSVAIAVFGIQVALEGLVRSLPQVARAGAGVAAAGTVSSWWTSGANDAVLGWLEPHGVTSADLAVATLSLLLLAGGTYAGRIRTSLSSWLTVAPGLGTLAVWLVDAQLTRSVDWAVPLALALGVVAVGVGGWRRLAAPLFIGTATVGTTIAVSAGPRLAELDSWVWLALGGLGLIAVAVLVERSVSADRAPIDWRALRNTWR